METVWTERSRRVAILQQACHGTGERQHAAVRPLHQPQVLGPQSSQLACCSKSRTSISPLARSRPLGSPISSQAKKPVHHGTTRPPEAKVSATSCLPRALKNHAAAFVAFLPDAGNNFEVEVPVHNADSCAQVVRQLPRRQRKKCA